MITYEFKNSFDKSVTFFSERDKKGIKELCKSFIDVLENKDVTSKGAMQLLLTGKVRLV